MFNIISFFFSQAQNLGWVSTLRSWIASSSCLQTPRGWMWWPTVELLTDLELLARSFSHNVVICFTVGIIVDNHLVTGTQMSHHDGFAHCVVSVDRENRHGWHAWQQQDKNMFFSDKKQNFLWTKKTEPYRWQHLTSVRQEHVVFRQENITFCGQRKLSPTDDSTWQQQDKNMLFFSDKKTELSVDKENSPIEDSTWHQ